MTTETYTYRSDSPFLGVEEDEADVADLLGLAIAPLRTCAPIDSDQDFLR